MCIGEDFDKLEDFVNAHKAWCSRIFFARSHQGADRDTHALCSYTSDIAAIL